MFQSAYNADKNAFAGSMEEMKNKLEESEREIERIKVIVSQKEKENELLRADLKAEDRESAAHRQANVEHTMARLSKEYEGKSEEARSYKRQVEDLRETVRNFEREKAEMGDTMERLRNEKRTAEGAAQRMKEETLKVRGDFDATSTEVGRMQINAAGLEQQAALLRSEKSTLEKLLAEKA